MADEYITRIRAFLHQNRISDFHFAKRGKHRAVVIRHNGLRRTVFFPCTGSDWRGAANCLSDIRHEIGLVNQPKERGSVENPRKGRRSHAPRSLHAMRRLLAAQHAMASTPDDKFYSRLAELKNRMGAVETTPATVNMASDDREIGANGAHPPDGLKCPSERIQLRTPWLGRRARYTEHTYH